VAIMLATPLFAELPRLRPGKYEVQTQLAMPGRASAPPRAKEQCIGPEDLKDLSRKLSTMPQKPNCAVSDYKQSAGAVRFTQICNVPDASFISKVNLTFPSDESFRGVVELSSTWGPDAPEVPPMYRGSTITITAKRIGDCTK
jgi:hypothetical protein